VSQSEVSLLGIKHTDERIHSLIDDETDSLKSVGAIYHEQPESRSSFSEHSKWVLLKNPVGIFSSLRYLLQSMVSMRRGLTVEDTGTVQLKSECRIAAERLRDELDAPLTNIGMNRTELLKRRSWLSAVYSWVIVGLALWVCGAVVVTSAPVWLVFLLIPLILAVDHRSRTLTQIREMRDVHMASNILDSLANEDPETAVVIVGEKHLPGIGAELGAAGYRPICRWVSQEADRSTTFSATE
jgi:hypothetical protein